MTRVLSALLVLAGLMIHVVPAGAETPARRVVSVNLCTDQLLLALADRDQIASLSPFSGDRALSYLADRAAGLPMNRGTGEDVVRLAADLVLIGPYDNRATRALIAQRGVEMLVLGPWTSLADGRTQLRALAARLGQQARGEALVARIDVALEGVRGIAPADRRVLVVHRRFFVSGRESVTAEVLAAAGFTDASTALGLQNGGFVSLERLLRAAPDYLVVSPGDQTAEDQGSALMEHPAMLHLYPARKRIPIPDRLTICGGPSTPDLIETLGQEIRARAR
jgi:iron complex transport system substrate-binding protein